MKCTITVEIEDDDRYVSREVVINARGGARRNLQIDLRGEIAYQVEKLVAAIQKELDRA